MDVIERQNLYKYLLNGQIDKIQKYVKGKLDYEDIALATLLAAHQLLGIKLFTPEIINKKTFFNAFMYITNENFIKDLLEYDSSFSYKFTNYLVNEFKLNNFIKGIKDKLNEFEELYEEKKIIFNIYNTHKKCKTAYPMDYNSYEETPILNSTNIKIKLVNKDYETLFIYMLYLYIKQIVEPYNPMLINISKLLYDNSENRIKEYKDFIDNNTQIIDINNVDEKKLLYSYMLSYANNPNNKITLDHLKWLLLYTNEIKLTKTLLNILNNLDIKLTDTTISNLVYFIIENTPPIYKQFNKLSLLFYYNAKDEGDIINITRNFRFYISLFGDPNGKEQKIFKKYENEIFFLFEEIDVINVTYLDYLVLKEIRSTYNIITDKMEENKDGFPYLNKKQLKRIFIDIYNFYKSDISRAKDIIYLITLFFTFKLFYNLDDTSVNIITSEELNYITNIYKEHLNQPDTKIVYFTNENINTIIKTNIVNFKIKKSIIPKINNKSWDESDYEVIDLYPNFYYRENKIKEYLNKQIIYYLIPEFNTYKIINYDLFQIKFNYSKMLNIIDLLEVVFSTSLTDINKFKYYSLEYLVNNPLGEENLNILIFSFLILTLFVPIYYLIKNTVDHPPSLSDIIGSTVQYIQNIYASKSGLAVGHEFQIIQRYIEIYITNGMLYTKYEFYKLYHMINTIFNKMDTDKKFLTIFKKNNNQITIDNLYEYKNFLAFIKIYVKTENNKPVYIFDNYIKLNNNLKNSCTITYVEMDKNIVEDDIDMNYMIGMMWLYFDVMSINDLNNVPGDDNNYILHYDYYVNYLISLQKYPILSDKEKNEIAYENQNLLNQIYTTNDINDSVSFKLLNIDTNNIKYFGLNESLAYANQFLKTNTYNKTNIYILEESDLRYALLNYELLFKRERSLIYDIHSKYEKIYATELLNAPIINTEDLNNIQIDEYRKTSKNFNIMNKLISQIKKNDIEYLLDLKYQDNVLEQLYLYKKYKLFNDNNYKSNNSINLIKTTNNFISKNASILNLEIYNYEFIKYWISEQCSKYYFYPSNEENEDIYYIIIDNFKKIENIVNIYFNFTKLDVYKDSFKYYNLTLIIRSFDIDLLKMLKPYLIQEKQHVNAIIENESLKIHEIDLDILYKLLNDDDINYNQNQLFILKMANNYKKQFFNTP
jgi:hypothetical protein